MTKSIWTLLGPLFVIVGAALWGIETYFRVNLNAHFDSEVLVFHEHLFCIALTLPAFVFVRPSFRGIKPRTWLYLILSGSVGSALGTYFFTLSLRTLNPSVANVLLNFQPIISVLFATALLHEKLGKGFLIWGAIALCCGLVIASSDLNLNSGPVMSIGLLFVALTAMAWGFSTVAGRGTMLEMPLPLAALARFSVGAVTLLISLLLKGKFTAELMNWPLVPQYWHDFFYLSLFTGVIPLYFYFKGLQKTSASVGGFCELTQTFSALLVTWGVMGHALTLSQVTAGACLMIAVYKINLAHAEANAH